MKQHSAQTVGLLGREKKREAIEAIIAYYQREKGEEIGIIAAEEILDFVLEMVGTEIYNKAVEDTKVLVVEKMTGILIDIEAILKK